MQSIAASDEWPILSKAGNSKNMNKERQFYISLSISTHVHDF